MTQVKLCIEQSNGCLVPILAVNAGSNRVPELLQAVGQLAAFIPIRAVIEDKLVTTLVLTKEGCEVRGEMIQWTTTNTHGELSSEGGE